MIALPQRKQKIISDVFALELEKLRINEEVSSDALLFIKEAVHTKKAKKFREMNNDALLNQKLILNADIKIKLTRWNWNSESEDDWINNMKLKSSMYPVLLRSTHLRIIEEPLTDFSFAVLRAFQKGNNAENAMREIINSFESVSTEKSKTIKDMIFQQIKQSILAGILIEYKF